MRPRGVVAAPSPRRLVEYCYAAAVAVCTELRCCLVLRRLRFVGQRATACGVAPRMHTVLVGYWWGVGGRWVGRRLDGRYISWQRCSDRSRLRAGCRAPLARSAANAQWRQQHNRVIPFITSPSGGIAPHGLAHLKMLARASRLPGGRDGTRYGLSRLSPRSFFTHHLQRISAALVRANARDVFDLITGLKQRAAAMDA